MFEPENVLEGPIKQSIESVFNTINSKAEGLDLLKKYRNANRSYVRALVENVQILGMSEPVKLIDIYSITQVSTTINRRLYNVDWENINSVTKTQSLVPSRKLKTNLRADDYIEKTIELWF
ncbi:hypothetical protein K3H45_14510 [Aeromonas veronii]|uniref:hypothetical protein n=1 Tax=Aeromonas veronii TaxID=654 RepID=UPI001F19A6C8|nr:hypothetical protein [Aeromonas veronii]MCF5761090.1 hypothetical protein [Aeromonas veronii]